jgi:hypothetical protein
VQCRVWCDCVAVVYCSVVPVVLSLVVGFVPRVLQCCSVGGMSGRRRQLVCGAALRMLGLCVGLVCGRMVQFGCRTWWKSLFRVSLFQCEDYLILV